MQLLDKAVQIEGSIWAQVKYRINESCLIVELFSEVAHLKYYFKCFGWFRLFNNTAVQRISWADEAFARAALDPSKDHRWSNWVDENRSQ